MSSYVLTEGEGFANGEEMPSLVRVRRGNIPVLLTAGHGGLYREGEPIVEWQKENFEGERRKTTENSRFVAHADVGTLQLIGMISRCCKDRPFLVGGRFSRKYIDVNRSPEEDAYFGCDGLAKEKYDWYHGQVDAAIREMMESVSVVNPRPALLLDIHGQSDERYEDMIIIGTLGKTSLEEGEEDFFFHRFAAELNRNVREAGLGTVYPLRKDDPDVEDFSGGYTIRSHLASLGDERIGLNRVQLEFPRKMRGHSQRPVVAKAVAKAIENYLSGDAEVHI